MSKLPVATEGPCKGHPCDNCWQCKRGQCCRRDHPDYQMPKLGEWDGPVYGELGVLNDDGEKLECHCCGEWFVGLNTHIRLNHNLTAREYRSIFGLAATRSLLGPVAAATVAQKQKNRLASDPSAFRLSGPINVTPERLSQVHSTRTRSLDEQRKKSDALREMYKERRMIQHDRPSCPTCQQIDDVLRHEIIDERVRYYCRKCNRYFIENPKTSQHQGIKHTVRQGETTSSRYVGVFWHKLMKRWCAAIFIHGKPTRLGYFHNEEEAAKAYDQVARMHYGDKAVLNFPGEALDDRV